MDDTTLDCSFCHKKQWEVKKLIAGIDVYICDECVNLCYDILDQESNTEKPKTAEKPSSTLTPIEIKKHLDQYLIGQDQAKEIISVAVTNHYKRLKHPVVDGVELEKANIALIGPSASGKTYLAKTLARKLNVPLAIADATSITEAGYVGDDVESIISRLYQVAGCDKSKAEQGIVFIDEIDKKAKRTDGGSSNRDISGEGVQQALLKLIEGDKIKIAAQGGKRTAQSEIIEIDTSGILFILAGAFVGLESIIENRLKGATRIGFSASFIQDESKNSLLSQIQADDLIKFGMIPELIGRVPIISYMEELTEDQLVQVIVEPKNSISKQYAKLFELEGIELEITDDGLKELARLAKARNTGARGLRSVLESVLTKTQFELSTFKAQGLKKIVIDSNVIQKKSNPVMVFDVDNEKTKQ